MGRLVGYQRSTQSAALEWVGYGYDLVGNRISESAGGVVGRRYIYDPGNYLSRTIDRTGQTEAEFTYGGFGEQLTRTSGGVATNYVYDAAQRLMEASRGGAVIASAVYDALGRRIVYTDSSGTVLTLYSGNDIVYEQADRPEAPTGPGGPGTGDPGDPGTPNPPGGKPIVIDDPKILDDPIEPDGGEFVLPDGSVPEPPPGSVRTATRYIVAHGKYLAKIVQEGANPAQTYFLHTDMLGSIRAVTDSAGQVVARFDYEPFGLLIEESSPASAGGERYTGKPLDAELGLYYFGARYYDPGLGRFITADPARDGLNWYAYCANNPLAYIDPDGKQSTEAVAAGAVWLCLVDGPLPLGDAIYVSLVGLTATFEYAPAVLDKLAAVGDRAMDSLRMLFSDNNRLKSQISGLTKPIRDHLDKLAGRAPKSEGDPRIPRNRSKWVEDAQRAWNNIVERLNKLGKPLPQVLREWGWEKERIDALIQDMIASGIDFADMDRWLR